MSGNKAEVFDVIYSKMVDYLSRSDMAETRLVDRIMRLRQRFPEHSRYRGFTRELAWRVVAKLRTQGLIDEERFARACATSLANRYDGIYLIRQKMMRRQIAPAVTERVLKDFEKQNDQRFDRVIERAQRKAQALRAKKGSSIKARSEVRQRLYMWLRSRGYRHDECLAILRQAFSSIT